MDTSPKTTPLLPPAVELSLVGRLWARATVRWTVYALVYLGVFLALHPGLWDGKRFLGWDVLDYAWPNIEYLKNAIAGGELPLWCPYEKAGFSFIADPETGVLYPVHWLMALLSGIFGSGAWIMLVQVLAHVLIAALGMHYYLRRQELAPQACWTGSFAYVLSSRLAKSKDQTALGTVAWFPWMLIAIEETVRRPSWRPAAALGLVVGIDLLAGYPPNFFRNVVGLTIVFGFEVGVVLSQTRERKAYLLRLGRALLIGGAVAAALTAPMILALASYGLQESARSGMGLDEVLRSSLRPLDALQLVAPGIRGKSSFVFYLGFAPVVLALLALLRYSGRRLLWASVAIVFFLLACAGHTPLMPLLIQLFPPFGLFRVSEQYLFVAAFFIALLAARGLTDILALGEEARRSYRKVMLLIVGASFFVALASLVVALLNRSPSVLLIQIAGTSLPVIIATTLVLVGLFSESARNRKVAAWLVLPLLLLDLGMQNRCIYDIVKAKPNLRHDPELSQLYQRDKDIRRDVRVADENYYGFRVSMRHEVRDIFGRQTALISERYRRFILRAKRNPQLLAAANVRYYAGLGLSSVRAQAKGHVRTIKPGVIELTDAAPLAYWVGRPTLVKNERAALAALSAGAPGSVGVLEQGDLTAAERKQVTGWRSAAQPVTARLLAYRRNSLKLALDVPAPGLLVINEKYARGWQATINGKPARLVRANYLFRGLLVGGGPQEIVLSYRPTRVLFALVLFALVLGLLCALAIGHVLRRRRSSARDR